MHLIQNQITFENKVNGSKNQEINMQLMTVI